MSLISRISGFDTWAELERAAEERYWDGMALATDPEGRHCGAVYLWGYVAEMLLKVAYYRFRNKVKPTDDVQAELVGIPARAKLLGLRWPARNLHRLNSLALLLIEERKIESNPMDPYVAAQLQGHVNLLMGHWTEILRYKDEKATPFESSEVLNSIDWLWSNWSSLWS